MIYFKCKNNFQILAHILPDEVIFNTFLVLL